MVKMERYKHGIRESIYVKSDILRDESLLETLRKIVETTAKAFNNGKRVFFCGNGGSAADAQHLAAELSGRFCYDRKALPAEAIHCNASYLTAVANDYSFDKVFARYIEGFGRSGDILFALSTSGASENVIKALQEACAMSMITIGLTGKNRQFFDKICDYVISIPSTNTARIQECHMLLGHIICEEVEKILFPR
jgi:D-sedoheptulose 7-phosphate isomerase